MIFSTKTYNKTKRGAKNAFSITELIVVIVIIGVFSTIIFTSYSSIRADTRDQQRASKVKLISEALERYYQQYGSYPVCDPTMIDTPSNVVDILKNLDPNALTTPSDAEGTNSLTCDMPLTTDKYAYEGDDGSYYRLWYFSEVSNAAKSIENRGSSTF